ncbi:MAG: threonine synthase, partial [Ruminococcus sp.]|nr:threonine synthase [Ruminococcus sp.]
TTISPSMDILVSSNLERLLYKMSDNNDKLVRDWMHKLKTEGVYEVPVEIKEKIKSSFFGGFCDEDNTQATIKNLFDSEKYLCDTHTAVAVSVYDDYVEKTGDKTPAVIASTASPYKFSKSVLEALSSEALPESEFDMVDMLYSISDTKVPTPIAELKGLTARFDNVTDKDEMKQTVFNALGIN